MVRLKVDDISFMTGVDDVGRVFKYEGRVYRLISHHKSAETLQMLESGSLRGAFGAGLVETSVADIEVPGSALVLEHCRVEPLSVWKEWCTEQIRAAAVMTCEMNLELLKVGLFTKDTQPGNISFMFSEPVWVDFGSIVPLEDVNIRSWFRALWSQTVLPLWLMAHGVNGLGRAAYTEVAGRGYLQALAARLHGVRPWLWTRASRSAGDQRTLARTLELLRDDLVNMKLRVRKSRWARYGQGGMPAVDRPAQFAGKNRAVFELLENIGSGRVLDIGCNKGWYSALCEKLGHDVVAVDREDDVMCGLYKATKGRRILPLRLDFAWPTAPYGIGLNRPSSYERLASEITLALALVHHLVFGQGMYFDGIVNILSMYTKRVSVVEFVPPGDVYVDKWMDRRRSSWYSLEGFLEELGRVFRNVAVFESVPAPRKLIVCEK